MKLIKATAKDVQELLDIEKTAKGLKTYSGYFQKHEIEKWISEEVVYLIKEKGDLVGSIAYEIKNKNEAHISGLVIRPEFQKKGLAKEAMLELLQELAGYQKIDLVTHPDNVGAVKLYESLGFVEVDRQENFFGDGQPRIIMVKKQIKR